MYEAAANLRPFNPHKSGTLPMSLIGDPCLRKLWFKFRGFVPQPFEGRVIVLFRLGDRIEDEAVFLLQAAGYKVFGQQHHVTAHNSLFNGALDGIIQGVTSKDHLLEIKSANKKRFDKFKKDGVQKTDKKYWAQIQCYMGYARLERCLFIVYHKDTSEIYTERIYFVRPDFQKLHFKAHKIISINAPPGIRFGRSSFECRYCDYIAVCRPGEHLPHAKQVCGTCHSLWMTNCFPACTHKDHYNFPIKTWGIGCPDWTHRGTTKEAHVE